MSAVGEYPDVLFPEYKISHPHEPVQTLRPLTEKTLRHCTQCSCIPDLELQKSCAEHWQVGQ